jgi:hypothetical protein
MSDSDEKKVKILVPLSAVFEGWNVIFTAERQRDVNLVFRPLFAFLTISSNLFSSVLSLCVKRMFPCLNFDLRPPLSRAPAGL